MGAINVRNIPDDIHFLLKAQAKQNHRSTEAEVRSIIETVVRSRNNQGFGQDLCRSWSHQHDLDVTRSQERPGAADFS